MRSQLFRANLSHFRLSGLCSAVPFLLFIWISFDACQALAQNGERGERMLDEYFRTQTEQISQQCLSDIESLDDWLSKRDGYRRQLLEMLGLTPFPERTPLNVRTTRTLERDQVVVENIYFESLPGLYVTGNLYRPKQIDARLPTILYVCGHGRVKMDGVSYGNKVHYQHHGAWFAKNGYVCLTIDSLQLGEIEGLHHGTYRHNMWSWLNRGYTPAGVEAWNCIRALDYLQSREDVDGDRIGVTGRSGGGAYSWWIAAIDERIKCAVPVAGITDLQNHIVDGCVEGHCDCMYFVNTYQWDYPMVAALVAPRPLLISNSDRDSIFPLDGVVRTHAKVARVYDLYEQPDKLGLNITSGPHRDTQELRISAFRWLNIHLKNDERLIDTTATALFEPSELLVFVDSNTEGGQRLPSVSRNANIQNEFVAPRLNLGSNDQIESLREYVMRTLRDQVFRAWPRQLEPQSLEIACDITRDQYRLRAFDIVTQSHVALRLFLLQNAQHAELDELSVFVLDERDWVSCHNALLTQFPDALREIDRPWTEVDESLEMAQVMEEFLSSNQRGKGLMLLAPRGIASSGWSKDPGKSNQIRRRFYLLGQTLESMQVFDVACSLQGIKHLPHFAGVSLSLSGHRQNRLKAFLASMFIDAKCDCELPPLWSEEAAAFLNLSRYLTLDQLLQLQELH